MDPLSESRGDFVRQMGVAICNAWGLDASLVCAIDLRWRPDELPTALIETKLTEGVMREVLTLVPISRSPSNGS